MDPTPLPRPAAISDSELDLLKALWDGGGEATVRDLGDRVGDRVGGGRRAYTTVQTLLNRLVDKGYAATRRDGRALVYRPTVSRDELVTRRLDEIVDRVCDGSASPVVLNLARTASFTPKEIESFRKLLDELERTSAAEGEEQGGGDERDR